MNSVSNFLPDDIPELLKSSNEEIIFKDGIDAREKFHKFYNKNIDKIILENLPSTLKTIENTTPSVAFVAGSRAWEYNFNNKCQEYLDIKELSSLEQNSILPGNYDIFCVCTDKNKIDDIYKQICICFDNIMSQLNENKEISSIYSLTYVSNVGKEVTTKNKQKIPSHKFYATHLEKYCPLNTEFLKDGCVFPECKAMHLELTFDPINKKSKKKREDSFDEKVVLYFEVIYIPEPDTIQIINKELVFQCESSMKYLNLTGLYLFAELILKRSKEYDVDLYRKRILEKVLVRYNIDPERMYLKIIKLYKQLFTSREDYKFKLGILLKNLIELYDNDLITSFSSNIIEAIRPYINTFVLSLDSSFGVKQKAYIFIKGGDAYRRYLDDIKRTNDIDTMVIYKNENDKPYLINTIAHKLSELTAILYKNKSSIFRYLESDIIHLGKDNIVFDVQFNPVYNIKDDGNDKSAGQFRLRYIDKDNLTLFSIDYRTKIYVYLNVGDLNIKTVLNYDIPILDLVLANSGIKYSFAVQLSHGLPVASSQYLQEDLKDMYKEIDEGVKLRFHKKSSKDRSRFISLVNYLKKAKGLLESSRDLKLKRKIEDMLDDMTISKRRKDYNDIIMKDVIYEHDFMDIDLNKNVEIIDISNFKNFPIIFKNTLDKHFDIISYKKGILKHQNTINSYADMLLNKIHENDTRPIDEKQEKLQLSFNDISDVFTTKEQPIEETLDLFSKLTI
jgi:hypothetical protein